MASYYDPYVGQQPSQYSTSRKLSKSPPPQQHQRQQSIEAGVFNPQHQRQRSYEPEFFSREVPTQQRRQLSYEPEPFSREVPTYPPAVGRGEDSNQEYRDHSPSPPPPEIPPKDEGLENARSFFEETEEGSHFASGPEKKPRTAANYRKWRYENQGALWTKGSAPRRIGRFCCCTVMIVVFFLVSVAFPLVLWARPPDIAIANVAPPTTGSAIQIQDDGLSINLGVDIAVSNPNYFGINVPKIQADIFYPIGNTAFGGGVQHNLVFNSHAVTNFTFPFQITYKRSLDPNHQILADLATKCGFIGGQKSNIKMNYKITLGLRFLFVTISPTISNSFSFACPLQQSDLTGLFGGASLGSILGGGAGI